MKVAWMKINRDHDFSPACLAFSVKIWLSFPNRKQKLPLFSFVFNWCFPTNNWLTFILFFNGRKAKKIKEDISNIFREFSKWHLPKNSVYDGMILPPFWVKVLPKWGKKLISLTFASPVMMKNNQLKQFQLTKLSCQLVHLFSKSFTGLEWRWSESWNS